MKVADMQVIGLCRFSYPAQGGFQVGHGSDADRQAYLWSPERMEERFATFEAFTLPSIKAQTDPNFTFLIVIGDEMPATFCDRLTGLLEGFPQAIVQRHPPGPHRDVMKTAINSVRQVPAVPGLQFRLDDDDAVSVRYVERLREVAQDNRPLLRQNRHVAIDFTQGFIARAGPDGIAARATVEPLWTAALAISVKRGARNTIMNFGHSKLPRFMPVVSFTGEDMFVRGHNDHNDSRQKKGVAPVTLDPLSAQDEAHFKRVYNVDADAVRAIFRRSRASR